MSTFGLVALLLLPILGGLIAWAGDVIGYRLGKSRRTLFGLRPRTTARVVGVAVGVALPLVGLGTALVGSSYAREAIFRLDKLLDRQVQLSQENSLLEQTVAATRAEAQQARRRADALALERNHKAKEVLAARRQYGRAQARLAQANGAVRALRETVGTLRNTKQVVLAQLRRLDRDLDHTRQELGATQHTLEQRTADLHRTDADLTRRSGELAALQARYQALENAYRVRQDVVSRGEVLFEPGHELIRGIFDVKVSAAEMEEALRRLLIPASEAAFQQGATVGSNGLAVRLAYPVPPEWKPGEDYPSQEEIIRYVASQLRAAEPEQMVVGVRVVQRVFPGESQPPRVEFWAVPYRLIFDKGDIIYAVTIDGDQPRSEIFTQLWNLITRLVRREAKAKGLLPHPKTGEYGSLPAAQLLEALDAISALKAPARVEVVASRPTHTTDPLVIKIEVKRDSQTRQPAAHNRG